MSDLADIRFEWQKGPYRLSVEDSRTVMAHIEALEAAGALMADHFDGLLAESDGCDECVRALAAWKTITGSV